MSYNHSHPPHPNRIPQVSSLARCSFVLCSLVRRSIPTTPPATTTGAGVATFVSDQVRFSITVLFRLLLSQSVLFSSLLLSRSLFSICPLQIQLQKNVPTGTPFSCITRVCCSVLCCFVFC